MARYKIRQVFCFFEVHRKINGKWRLRKDATGSNLFMYLSDAIRAKRRFLQLDREQRRNGN